MGKIDRRELLKLSALVSGALIFPPSILERTPIVEEGIDPLPSQEKIIFIDSRDLLQSRIEEKIDYIYHSDDAILISDAIPNIPEISCKLEMEHSKFARYKVDVGDKFGIWFMDPGVKYSGFIATKIVFHLNWGNQNIGLEGKGGKGGVWISASENK
jgi:hypothetical protein